MPRVFCFSNETDCFRKHDLVHFNVNVNVNLILPREKKSLLSIGIKEDSNVLSCIWAILFICGGSHLYSRQSSFLLHAPNKNRHLRRSFSLAKARCD